MQRLCSALVVLTCACTPAGQPEPGPASVDMPERVDMPEGAVITMRRSACIRTCPSYEVTLESDGTVRWVGMDDVERETPDTFQISKSAVASLWHELDGLFETKLANHDDRRCGQGDPDKSTTHVELEADGRTREFWRHGDCIWRHLIRAEKRIDIVAGTERWIGDKGRSKAFKERHPEMLEGL